MKGTGVSQRSASKANTSSYVQTTKFGVVDPDEVTDETLRNQIDDKTPTTAKRMALDGKSQSVVKKLGPIQTCFTIFKGFVATGILYVPADFKNGGWLFTPISLVISLCITLYCAKLLL